MDGIRWVLDPDGHPTAGQPLYDEPIGLVARRDLSRTVGITTVTAAASTPRPKHSSATSTGPCPMDRRSVDRDTPQRSNAYGWLHADDYDGGPLSDPLHNCVAEVHVYLDEYGSGTGQDVVSTTVARANLAHAVDEARA